jgi:4-hydroxyphenylacetate 3-monooxygenase
MPKTGADHLNSLRDGRTIYLDGQRIPDVVEHPAYRNAIRSTAYLYDFQAAPANLECLTFPSPTTGDHVNRCWQLPYSYADLVQRREALTAWAETTYGFMGRSPDHVASCLSGRSWVWRSSSATAWNVPTRCGSILRMPVTMTSS